MQVVFFEVREVLFACHALIVTRKLERVLQSYFFLFLCLFQNRFRTVVRGLGMILFKILVIKEISCRFKIVNIYLMNTPFFSLKSIFDILKNKEMSTTWYECKIKVQKTDETGGQRLQQSPIW
jgi:hypothetical protein